MTYDQLNLSVTPPKGFVRWEDDRGITHLIPIESVNPAWKIENGVLIPPPIKTVELPPAPHRSELAEDKQSMLEILLMITGFITLFIMIFSQAS
ncbi:hypothetical protein FACS189490_10330 [Clostridia bacterium]|nr:hypothetical protein FACS189490_10330 [Clostridia bacterium]